MDITDNVDRVEQFQSDHRALLTCICGLRDWTREVSEWGMPRFGELGARLSSFRTILAEHFAEEEAGKHSMIILARATLPPSEQHDWILERLDSLIGSLRAPEPEFRSWQIAVQEVESIIADVCDHEQQGSGTLPNAKSGTSATKSRTA